MKRYTTIISALLALSLGSTLRALGLASVASRMRTAVMDVNEDADCVVEQNPTLPPMPRLKSDFLLLCFCIFAPVASAATIAYVGNEYNVEAFTDDSGVGWRNSSTAKAFDLDGDNVIGTDGYDFAGGSPVVSLPSYVASVTFTGGHNDQNRGLVDDPTDPSGADIGTGWNGNGTSGTIVFQGSDMSSKTMRLAVLYDSTWSGIATGTQTFTLTQTVGGSDSITTPTVTLGNDGLDIAFFDITGIEDGDTFSLTTTKGTISWRQITGVAFDTPAPPSSSHGTLIKITSIWSHLSRLSCLLRSLLA